MHIIFKNVQSIMRIVKNKNKTKADLLYISRFHKLELARTLLIWLAFKS